MRVYHYIAVWLHLLESARECKARERQRDTDRHLDRQTETDKVVTLSPLSNQTCNFVELRWLSLLLLTVCRDTGQSLSFTTARPHPLMLLSLDGGI